MMLKFIKFCVGIDIICLSAGYLNGKFKQKTSYKKEDLEKSFNLEAFGNQLFEITNDEKIPSFKNELKRDEMLKNLSETKLDLLVIGGGCNGAGVLFEAHKNGLKAGLIEANDFASGTSSRSTKLIHGGIRYLQDVFSFGGSPFEKISLVYEALAERDFLLNSTPFMSNFTEIKIPCKNFLELNYYYLGVLLYHGLYVTKCLISGNSNYTFPGPKIYMKEKYVSFYEGQMFDSRQCLLTILTTLTQREGEQSSLFANHIEFKEYTRDSQTNKINGIIAFDKLNKKIITINSDVVVNCTGVLADINFNKEDKLTNQMISAAQGTHLVFQKKAFENSVINKIDDAGYMIPHTTDGRILFILPYQRDYYLVGTTDNPIDKHAKPEVNIEDTDYIINELCNNIPNLEKDALMKNISSKWSGFRPLVRAPIKHSSEIVTKSLARNHVIRIDDDTGLVSLLGGKWTTYRKMGEDVINHIKNSESTDKRVCELIKTNQKNIKKDVYSNVLLGSVVPKHNNFLGAKKFFGHLELYIQQKFNLDEKTAKDLVFKYGINSLKVIEIYLTLHVKDKESFLKSQIKYSIKYEMAIKPNDFICRRSGIAFIDIKQANELLEKVNDYMSLHLNLSKEASRLTFKESKENLRYLI